MADPGQFLFLQLLGLLAFGVFALGIYLLYLASKRRVILVRTDGTFPSSVPRTSPSSAAPAVASDARLSEVRPVADLRWERRRRWLLGSGLVLFMLPLGGRFLLAPFFAFGSEIPDDIRPFAVSDIKGSSGAILAIAEYGTKGGPTLILTHGWGNDRRQWLYLIHALPKSYHVVVWDLPGLGESTPAKDYSLATLAGDLDSVVSHYEGQPLVLVGHSIGGMLNLEFAKRYPQKLGREVRGIVEANTSYTNPVLTKKGGERSAKLQKPVFEPLLHMIEWISPIARAGGWFAYESGLAHLQLAMDSFAGTETWDELDQMAKYAYRSSPGIIARGTLGMLHWDASNVLQTINVPTLVIVGVEDTTTLPSAGAYIAREVPSARLVAVEPAKHLGPIEQYRRYALEVAAFASRALAQSPAPG